jgi:hypothetical protein
MQKGILKGVTKMKKLFLVGVVLIAMLGMASSGSVAQSNVNEYFTMGLMNDSLTVANSQIYDTSTTISPSGYSYIAAVVNIDWKAAGLGGAGYIYFEGSTTPTMSTYFPRVPDSQGYWVRLPFVTVSDSLEVVTSQAFSGAADVGLAAIISIMPNTAVKGVTTEARGSLEGAQMGNFLPFRRIRMVISDTNWTAKAVVTGYWVVRK